MPIDNTTSGPNNLSSGNPDPHTIKSDGCYMTCLGMIAGIDPATADTVMSNNNHIFLNGSLKAGAPSDVGLNVDSSYSATVANVPAALASSNAVLAVVNHGGRTHYVVITGTAYNPATGQCDYTIADPGTSSPGKYLSQYQLQMLVQVSYSY